MADNQSMDRLFQAIDIITNKRLESLGFDKTVRARIIDDSNSNRGIYTVSEIGNASFLSSYEAYSENTNYEVGTDVQVTIPRNDYNANKIIVGKCVDVGDDYTVYLSPLENYLDITGNIISMASNKWSILANGDETLVPIWSSNNDMGIKGYDKISVSADFMTLLESYDIIGGTYGLMMVVIGKEDGHMVYNTYQILSSDMFGNPYSFISYSNQAAVFDISNISEVYQVSLMLVQNSDFYDKETGYITYPEGQDVLNNIYLTNPYVSFGYDASKVYEDQIRIYTYDDTEYDGSAGDSTTKTIQSRWIHLLEEGKAIVINENSSLLTSGEASYKWYEYIPGSTAITAAGRSWEEIESNENAFTYSFQTAQDPSITNQKFKIVAEIPSVSKVANEIRSNSLYTSLAPIFNNIVNDTTIGTIIDNLIDDNSAVASTVQETLADMYASSPNSFKNNNNDYFTNVISLLTYINEQKQAIKYYSSDILIFTNATYDPIAYAVDLIQELNISVDSAGLCGSYMIYDDNGSIISTEESNKQRTLKATYKSLVTGQQRLDVASAESVYWYIPLDNTMIQPPQNGIEYNTLHDVYQEMTSEQAIELGLLPGRYAKISRAPSENITGEIGDSMERLVTQVFRIKPYYTQQENNNTVYCKIIRDNKVYTASASLLFGVSGTNGTDATFLLEMFEVSDNDLITNLPASAITINSKVAIVPRFFNYENEEQKDYFLTHDIKYSWYTDQDTYDGDSTYENLYQNICNPTTKLYSTNVNSTGGLVVNHSVTTENEDIYGAILLSSVGTSTDLNNGKYDFYILRATVPYKQEMVYSTYTTQDVQKSQSESEDDKNALLSKGYSVNEIQDLSDGILKAGDARVDANGNPIDPSYKDVLLETYLPIPVRLNKDYLNVSGPSKIVYDINGTNPQYYKQNYNFISKNNTSVIWESSCKAVIAAMQNHTESNINNLLMYYPKLNCDNLLIPPTMFAMNGCDRRYSIRVKDNNGNVLWTQPILIIQNRYSSAMLNAWDGNLTIDEKNGTILSTMVGAGQKESDNTFSGVLMGQVSAADENLGNQSGLGIYGFHHNDQSFGFNIDGTAFLGKSGHGRINFNGNNGTITSGNYNPGHQGMEIDLDGPDNFSSSIKAYGAGGSFELDTSKLSGNSISFALKATANEDRSVGLFIADDSHHYISSINYNGKYGIGDNAYYPSGLNSELNPPSGESNTLATQGMFIDLKNGWIDARNGIIANWRITEKTLETLDGSIILDGGKDGENSASIYLGKIIPDAQHPDATSTSRGNIYTASYSISGVSYATTSNIHNPTVETETDGGEIPTDGYDPFNNIKYSEDFGTSYNDFQTVTTVKYNKPSTLKYNNVVEYIYNNKWFVTDAAKELNLNTNALTQGLALETGKINEYTAENTLERTLGIMSLVPTRPLSSEMANSWAFLGTETNPWDYIYANNGIYVSGDLVVTHSFLSTLANALNERMKAVNNLAAKALEKANSAGGSAGRAGAAAGAAAKSIAEVVKAISAQTFVVPNITIGRTYPGTKLKFNTAKFSVSDGNDGRIKGEWGAVVEESDTEFTGSDIVIGGKGWKGAGTISNIYLSGNGIEFAVGAVAKAVNSHSHYIEFTESNGTITLTIKSNENSASQTANFNMAATKYFQDQIAAAKEEGYSAALRKVNRSGNTVSTPGGTFVAQTTINYTATSSSSWTSTASTSLKKDTYVGESTGDKHIYSSAATWYKGINTSSSISWNR